MSIFSCLNCTYSLEYNFFFTQFSLDFFSKKKKKMKKKCKQFVKKDGIFSLSNAFLLYINKFNKHKNSNNILKDHLLKII